MMVKAGPKRRTQEERKAESERKIIHAALREFAKNGYQRTTLNQIGEQAGYTGGLVSHRFGSKSGLLKALIKHMTTRFMIDQVGDAMSQESAATSLAKFIDLYLQEVILREGTLRALYVITGEALAGVEDIQQDIAEFNRRTRDRIAKLISRGIKQGEFRDDINANAAAVLINGMLRGVAIQYMIDHKLFNVKKHGPMIKRAALDPLLKPSG